MLVWSYGRVGVNGTAGAGGTAQAAQMPCRTCTVAVSHDRVLALRQDWEHSLEESDDTSDGGGGLVVGYPPSAVTYPPWEYADTLQQSPDEALGHLIRQLHSD
jgi:hypothetical protein